MNLKFFFSRKSALVVFASFLLMMITGCATADIRQSNNINEIQQYITTHPGDAKIPFLKQKLAALQQLQKPGNQSVETKPINQTEEEEYAELASLDSQNHKQKTAAVLTQLLNENPSDPDAAVIVDNNSACNIIFRIKNGSTSYRLPVAAHGKNYILVPKGKYTMTSNICTAIYSSQKDVSQSITLAVGN